MQAAAEATAQRERSGNPGAPFVLFTLPDPGGPADATVFQTREGGIGIMQVLSTTPNPASVELRYKLVKPRAGPAAETDPAPPTTEPETRQSD